MSTTLQLTVEEYGQMISREAFEYLNRKIEFIRGEIRQMNPAGPLHNDLIDFRNDWSVRGTNRDSVHVWVQIGLDLF